jgi:cell division transport system permease protein
MRRFDYYFRETATGLRRNGIMAFAAMSTAFIALFLFGLALLIQREFNLVIFNITRNVEVAVYLSDPVQADNVAALTAKLQKLDAVASVSYETKPEACAKFKQIFSGQPVLTENVSCDVIPASLRVHLTDPGLFDQVKAALSCTDQQQAGGTTKLVCTEPGVATVADYSTLLNRLSTITKWLSLGVGFIAFLMLASAVALIANTLRMGMFARRREIGIMRLVGATNWRIRLPFLIEGLVESLLGAGLAILFLLVLKFWFINPIRNSLQFFPLIRNSDVLAIAPYIVIASALVALVAGTIGMRRFLDV